MSIEFHTVLSSSRRRKEERRLVGCGKVKGEYKCISVFGFGMGRGHRRVCLHTFGPAGHGERPVTPDAEGEWEETEEGFGCGLWRDKQGNRKQEED